MFLFFTYHTLGKTSPFLLIFSFVFSFIIPSSLCSKNFHFICKMGKNPSFSFSFSTIPSSLHRKHDLLFLIQVKNAVFLCVFIPLFLHHSAEENMSFLSSFIIQKVTEKNMAFFLFPLFPHHSAGENIFLFIFHHTLGKEKEQPFSFFLFPFIFLLSLITLQEKLLSFSA